MRLNHERYFGQCRRLNLSDEIMEILESQGHDVPFAAMPLCSMCGECFGLFSVSELNHTIWGLDIGDLQPASL